MRAQHLARSTTILGGDEVPVTGCKIAAKIRERKWNPHVAK
jgi:hypothetical protein